MPFKHNAARRHRIPQARYRVRNWRAYEAGLKRRGDLTLWLDEAALAGWQAPRRTTPGGQAWYSDAAIDLALMLRLVFHLALRQAEGLVRSVLRLLGQELRVPDHTTLSRRSRGFAGRQPKVVPHGPVHLVIDSTGLKLFGRGGWDDEKPGRARRSWRKLHIAVDAGAGEIVASVLTDNGADDAAQMPALLEAIEGEIASATADGAYDTEPVYQAIDRKSTRLNSSHANISYAVFCLKKKKKLSTQITSSVRCLSSYCSLRSDLFYCLYMLRPRLSNPHTCSFCPHR